jgi:predicted nucleic acid-binding protein
MIVLDTNVISELMRPVPAVSVLGWIGAQPAGVLYVTAISCAEIRFGLHVMPDGRRKQDLIRQAERMFLEDFEGHILDFGMEAAAAYAVIAGERYRSGRPLHPVDGMIAATARVHGAAVATRDRDLEGCGVPIVDPWRDAG